MNKRRVSLFLLMLMLGLFPLLNALGNPRLSGVHGSDFVQLISSGLCFGVGFGVLIGRRKFLGE
jgi:hypothetical protein